MKWPYLMSNIHYRSRLISIEENTSGNFLKKKKSGGPLQTLIIHKWDCPIIPYQVDSMCTNIPLKDKGIKDKLTLKLKKLCWRELGV